MIDIILGLIRKTQVAEVNKMKRTASLRSTNFILLLLAKFNEHLHIERFLWEEMKHTAQPIYI